MISKTTTIKAISRLVQWRFYSVITLFLLNFSLLSASDIVEIGPLTNRIILVVFDDGTVNYPNDLQVVRLNIADATSELTYSIVSSDDDDFSVAVNPVDIGRKSKGTEFVKDAPWGGNSFNPTTKPWASKHFIYLFLDKELKSGKSYTINTSELAENGSEWSFTFNEKDLRSEAVHVNTIGYETDAPKYGYVYQWMGDKGGLDLTSYNGNSYHIYKDGGVDPVLSGFLKKRKSATNAETGQPKDTPNRNFLGGEVYECDFSSITEDGTYTLVVEEIGCSYPFRIGKDALWDAYYKVGRALYYQRSGIRLAPPYTDGDYIRPVNQNTKVTSDDGTDFAGLLLYSNYPFTSWNEGDGGGSSQAVIRDSAIGKPLDVAGWYHDAGDWDGYYSHQRIPILLMLTYEYFPERFADGDLNLPESGNGIPDLVDEASWLIKFNYRLRKELMDKGYSDGGVGGARVCPDVFNSVDGGAEGNKPSWKDHRRYVVTKADAFMTYLYAGQAAQFAVILKKLGKDPNAFPVEMLDHVDFASMTKDIVDWEQEARDAYAWASAAENQPASRTNYSSEIGVYKMYAATSLYRLTNEEQYHVAAAGGLDKFKNVARLEEDERYGVYSYLIADNFSKDQLLHNALVNSAENNATFRGMAAADIRACRWGGIFDMPMLIGQATTPWVFEVMMAYGLTGEAKYLDVAHTTADYFLGNNPLHSTWATSLGPRPAEAGFHLDSRYNNNWVTYPGFIPYGPWSMSYGYQPFTWTIDGVLVEGGAGPWNKDWANFSQYPVMDEWPGHERWNSNIHAPLSTENTVHQNSVYGMLTYGFVNNRINTNADAVNSIGTITLDQTDLTITVQGDVKELQALIDIDNATAGNLVWTSSDKRVAHVDQLGRVTGVTSGSCIITCATNDGSVTAECNVVCTWAETAVDSISVEPDSLTLVEGQSHLLEVFFYPEGATNTFADWSYSVEGVVEVDETGLLKALTPGSVLVIATSLNGSKKDTCVVEVLEAVDYVIADFDNVVPVKTTPQPDIAQIYTPEGSSVTDQANPLLSSANESALVVKYNKPAGTWRLIGMVMPTADIQSTDKYSQFQFKYMGAGIEELYLQIKSVDETTYETTVPVEGLDAWRLFTYNLDASFEIKQFNLFVNSTVNDSMSCYMDDFILSALPAEWYDGLTISDGVLNMNSSDEYVLAADAEGNPFSWLSLDPAVATIDQTGKVTAVSKGSTKILAVPLYGDPVECEVNVDGGVYVEPENYETMMLLDFETHELDWSAGYGAYAWSSDAWSKTGNPVKKWINQSDNVFTWNRDNTSFGAGFGIQFPSVAGYDYSRLSFMVYAENEIEAVRIALKNGEEELGALQTSIEIVPYAWTQVVVNLDDFALTGYNFNRIEMQFGVGTEEEYTVYLDNVWLERGTTIPSEAIYIIDDSPQDISKGSDYQFTAMVSPVNATDAIISWESSKVSVATVSGTGLVTAVGGGTATITAGIQGNSSISASVDVIVQVGVTAVAIEAVTMAFIEPDSTLQLVAVVSPSDATNKLLEWSSDDPGIATVSSEGLVTGVAEGSVNISVTSVDNPSATDEVSIMVMVTGTEQFGTREIAIYPNPVSDHFTMISAHPVVRIELFSITGEQVLIREVDGQMEITVREINLQRGLYLVKVRMKDGEEMVGKLVVND